MKFLLSLISIGMFVVTGLCQSSAMNVELCSQKSIENISSRGIKLGMDIEETLKVFSDKGVLTLARPEYNESTAQTKVVRGEYPLQQALDNLGNDAKGQFGYSSITLSPTDKTKFDEISRYDLRFLDSRLASFSVYYLSPRWEGPEQFVRTMSGLFGLPIQEKLMNSSPYTLKCGDYTIKLRMHLSGEANSLMEVSAGLNEELGKRQKKAESERLAKEIKAFKP